ncbi:Oidioi.mRNA.OKI2018_I69.XSR.g14208.t1.cds [Oikopleura dioica]|uniref:Oidioi.mRNA.OKI2018_I69.XSR.g14208.t1.cds n=1 Tax=Oikopleura dioica TaxID=34765 RepID=A0ABN7SFE3_OIKDI|nr:Oidioi.mRNA.OKI2018_I69.XSR.g14208.t1.cds [Oikopleura dioica]
MPRFSARVAQKREMENGSQESGEDELMELTQEQRDGYRTLLLSKLQKTRELEAERAKIKSDIRKAKKKTKAAKTNLVGYREQVFENKSKMTANNLEVKNKAASLDTEFTGLLLAPFEVKSICNSLVERESDFTKIPIYKELQKQRVLADEIAAIEASQDGERMEVSCEPEEQQIE